MGESPMARGCWARRRGMEEGVGSDKYRGQPHRRSGDLHLALSALTKEGHKATPQ